MNGDNPPAQEPTKQKIVISLFRPQPAPQPVQPVVVPAPMVQIKLAEPAPIEIQPITQEKPTSSLIKLNFSVSAVSNATSVVPPITPEPLQQQNEDLSMEAVPVSVDAAEPDVDMMEYVTPDQAPVISNNDTGAHVNANASGSIKISTFFTLQTKTPPAESQPIQIAAPQNIQIAAPQNIQIGGSQPIQIAASQPIQIGVQQQAPIVIAPQPLSIVLNSQVQQASVPAENPYPIQFQVQQQQQQQPQQTTQTQPAPAFISIPLFNQQQPQMQMQQPLPNPIEQESISPVKLRIALQQPNPGYAQQKASVIPIALQPIMAPPLQGFAQHPSHQQPLSPYLPVYNFTQTPIGVFNPMQPMSQQPPMQRPKKLQVPLTRIYNLTHRQLAIKLDPKSLKFSGQLILSFELQPTVEEWLASLEEYHKVAIEIKLNAKHIQVTDMCELNGIERIKRFAFNEQDQVPTKQATVHQSRVPNVLRHISDIEQYERANYMEEITNGTVQKKSKLFGLRPRKGVAEMLSKLKPHLRILIEYQCDQITEGSTLRYVNYHDSSAGGPCKYFYTVDRNSECWMPQLVGSEALASPWQLRFAVPADYMVISSGVQTQRVQDQQQQALHVYEVEKACADRIGLVCMKFPKITTIESGRALKGQYGLFLSQQKQSCFNQAFVVEVMEYLQGLLGASEYPCKQIHLVFVPNLMAKKFPKQSISFGEGLHIFDEQILMRQNQIDKRHHFYKHLAGALTFDFFGSKVREAKTGDLWLLTAIRERIGDRMKKKKCGMLLHKYQVMRSIEKLYKQMKHGAELAPLQYSHSSEDPQMGTAPDQALSDIFYRKCSLLMHMIESSIDEQTLDKIFRGIYVDAIEQSDSLLSQFQFRKKFKKICGMHPIVYYKNWVWATSCPELELSYEFNKRNNSLDLQLKQTSAVQYGQSEHQNLSQKLDRIFQSAQPASELSAPLDALFVDVKQAARRWFTGNINIVIYQIEGNGGDILSQQHKMSLKEFKSTSTSHIPLQGKVKRTMNNRKKEDQVYTIEQKMQSDFGQFKMNEFELEDYPQETKNIFQDLDNSNPVLWIRVDPDMEFIRKVKIVQEKRNNWLFQLLREQDIIGQIEAVRRLHVYNEELVYEILKTVAGSENFFYKIRKEVLKTLRKMEIYTFNKFISHEMFLLKMFNTARMLPGDSVNTFYRENDFGNILEYYMERALLKAISKCKEEHLPLAAEKQKEVTDKMQQRQKQVAQENGTQQLPDEHASEPTTNANAICLPIIDSKVVRQRRTNKSRFDESQFKCTTETVARMLMRVLEQNDNSENDFDDSFYLKDLIACLGRMDNISLMPAIASEIYRQFKLDQISNNSPHFAITIGAIKAYFNLRKQLYKFRTEKEPNLESGHPRVQQNQAQIEAVTSKLQEIKHDVDKLLLNESQPLHIRQFIFMEEVKNLLKFQNKSFAEALILILKIVDQLQSKRQLMFALYSLRDLVLYFEQKKFANGKLNMIDVYQPQHRAEVKTRIWSLYSVPHAYLSPEFTYWTKRLIKRLFANHVPDCDLVLEVEYDPMWSQTESEILQQQTQLLQAEQAPQFVAPQQQQASQQPASSTQVQINTNYQSQQTQQAKQAQQQADERASKILMERERALSFGAVQSGGGIKIQIGIKQQHVSEDEIMVSDGSQGPDLAGEGSEIEQQDDESIIDPFADEKFDDPIMQRCWDVLGKIYYHFEVTDFLEPVTEESFGKQMYEEYCNVIENPMDISTIMSRMREHYYLNECGGDSILAKELFRKEVVVIFTNCKAFNERGTDIVRSAHRLQLEFRKLCHEYGLD